jgi:subtilisin-like proprotein convertase family protein
VDPNAACGTLLKLQLTVTYDDEHSVSFPVELRVGQPQGIALSATPHLPIPDADARGVTDVIDASASGKVSDQFRVGVQIKHSYRGDLKVTLISPGGKQVLLHDRSGLSADDLIGVYPITLQPKEALSKILGEPLNGRWQLQVADLAGSDTGTLEAWSLEDITSYQCE